MGHNLWRAVLGWMNIHLPPILIFLPGAVGFDPQPHLEHFGVPLASAGLSGINESFEHPKS